MISDLIRVKEQTDMQTMSREGNKLVHRWDGETLVVEPWGNNSLRVRSAVMREPEDTDYALLPQEDTAVSITVGEEKSEIDLGNHAGGLGMAQEHSRVAA